MILAKILLNMTSRLKLSNEIEKNSAKFQNLEGRRDKALEYLNSIEEGLELEQ